jgi:hypothetical protein
VSMHWFGTAWPSPQRPAPVCDDPARWVPVPVGQPCTWCGYLIAADDSGVMMPAMHADGSVSIAYAHCECHFRNVAGCYGLLSGGECSHEVDYREDALRVWALFTEVGQRA